MYQSLIVFLNRRCAVGCATCNADARPGNKGELSRSWLAEFFPRLEALEFSGYIVWTGGEPFLSLDTLEWGISAASDAGYHSEILTSAIWFDSHPRWLDRIAAYDNVSIRISLDAEHQEAVPMSRVISFIRRAYRLRLEVDFTLREIPGRDDFINRCIEEIKKELPEFYRHNHRRSRWLHRMPHIPLGEPVSCESGTQASQKKCKLVFRDMVIGEDGLVYPCCGLFTLPFYRELAIGDPLIEPWDVLTSRQQEFSVLKQTSPCHLCLESLRKTAPMGKPRIQV
jgi:organic radical activating enzyme